MTAKREKRIEETREIVAAMRTPFDHHDAQTPEELREAAYRRGLAHGLQMAIEIMASDNALLSARMSVKQRASQVHDWRYYRGKYRTPDHAKPQSPPWE